MTSSVLSRVKSALMGDVTTYGNRTFKTPTKLSGSQQSNYGRIYHDPEVLSEKQSISELLLSPLTLPAKTWKKLCSIGEHDAAKTR